MRSTYLPTDWCVAILCVLLLSPLLVDAQECSRRAVIQSDTDVYRYPPRYVTGVGWQGERLDVLTRETQVLLCGEREVPFGFSSKMWWQVAYRRGTDWRYGWILQEKAQERPKSMSIGRKQPERIIPDRAVLVPIAYQVLADAAEDPKERWMIPNTAPAPAAPFNALNPAAEPPADSPALAEQLALYWPLFGAMLFGMIAKAIVDLIDAWDKTLVYVHIRGGVVALLVSPIVFLGFLNAGQFEGSKQTFLVLLLLAFQNGFFWQTILKREGPRTPSRDQSSPVTTTGL